MSDQVGTPRKQKRKTKHIRVDMTLKQFRKYIAILQTSGVEKLREEIEADEKLRERSVSSLTSASQETIGAEDSLWSKSKSSLNPNDLLPEESIPKPSQLKTKSVVWKLLNKNDDAFAWQTHGAACTPRHSRCVACNNSAKSEPDEADEVVIPSAFEKDDSFLAESNHKGKNAKNADNNSARKKSGTNSAKISSDKMGEKGTKTPDASKIVTAVQSEVHSNDRRKEKVENITVVRQNVPSGEKVISKKSQPDTTANVILKPKTTSAPDNTNSTSIPKPKSSGLPLVSIANNNKLSTTTANSDKLSQSKSKSFSLLPSFNNYSREASKSDTTFEKASKRMNNQSLLHSGRHQKPFVEAKRWIFTDSPSPVRVFVSFYEPPQEKYIDGITDENGRPLLPVSRQNILRGMIYDKVNKSLYPPLPNTPKKRGQRMANLLTKTTVNKTNKPPAGGSEHVKATKGDRVRSSFAKQRPAHDMFKSHHKFSDGRRTNMTKSVQALLL